MSRQKETPNTPQANVDEIVEEYGKAVVTLPAYKYKKKPSLRSYNSTVIKGFNTLHTHTSAMYQV